MLNFNVLARQYSIQKERMYEMTKNQLLHDAVNEMVMELEPNEF